MIQACFSHPNTLSSEGSAGDRQMPENLITSTYQTRILNSLTYLTLTWSKSLLSHSLTIHVPDCISFTSISLNPTSFSFFRTRPGSKTIFKTHQLKIKLYWDFTRAEFTHNSAEPDSSFYIAITSNQRLEFFLGDLISEFTCRPSLIVTRMLGESTHLSRREHVFGNRNYVIRVPCFIGRKREIGIECRGGVLKVKFDGSTCVMVKRLVWKFRGHEKIRVDGVEIMFFWDVYNWVENGCGNSKNDGFGLFVFQVGDGGVWPEMMGPEKSLITKAVISPVMSSSSVLQWAEENSSTTDQSCGRSSCSSSTRSCNGSTGGGGFSLSIYAWRKICD